MIALALDLALIFALILALVFFFQPTIANALLPAEGNGYFSNYQLAAVILLAPAVLLRLLPFVKASSVSWTVYFLLVALTGVPSAIAYWTVMSIFGPRKNTKVDLPGRTLRAQSSTLS